MHKIYIKPFAPAVVGLALTLGLLIPSCSVRKSAHRKGEPTHHSKVESTTPTRLAEMATELHMPLTSQEGWQSLRATLRGRIALGDGKGFSSKINLQAQRGKGLRLSLQPFPLIEAARLWVTPEGLVLLDLINGVYTKVSYTDLGERLGFVPSYDQLESLILGQIFSPSGQPLLDILDRLTIKSGADGSLSLGESEPRGSYELMLSPKTRQPIGFSLRDKQGRVRFASKYSGVQTLGAHTLLPERTSLHLYAPNGEQTKELGLLELEFQKVGEGNSDPSSIMPQIKPSYERLSLDQILKMLENL